MLEKIERILGLDHPAKAKRQPRAAPGNSTKAAAE